MDFWCVCVGFFFFPLKFGAEGKRQFRSARERERERERERFGLESERGLGVVGCSEEGDFGLLPWSRGEAVVIVRELLLRMRHRQ